MNRFQTQLLRVFFPLRHGLSLPFRSQLIQPLTVSRNLDKFRQSAQSRFFLLGANHPMTRSSLIPRSLAGEEFPCGSVDAKQFFEFCGESRTLLFERINTGAPLFAERECL